MNQYIPTAVAANGDFKVYHRLIPVSVKQDNVSIHSTLVIGQGQNTKLKITHCVNSVCYQSKNTNSLHVGADD